MSLKLTDDESKLKKKVITINIGIDIGGNHIGIGIVDEQCNIIKKEITNYNAKEVKGEQILNLINDFMASNDISEVKFIGIGIPGFAEKTSITYTCNLPLSGMQIKDFVHTDIPIKVCNDANCAALAEYQLGGYKENNVKNFALVTIGTGIGGGIVLNGKMLNGASNAAGEIGHMVIEKSGLKCNCGRLGCFEQYASVTALKRIMNLDSLEEIFHLLEKNLVIQNVFNQYLENLSEGLANLVNIFDLEVIAIGGGMSYYGEKYLTKLEENIKSKICNKVNSKFTLKTAKLTNDAGIIGAALLEKEEL